MTQMLLTAKSYADLKPFEMMAKRFGITVEAVEKNKYLENYKAIAKVSRSSAKKAGLSRDDISATIKGVRKSKVCV